ncbi:hypothetical protein GALMADRAFT_252775 [Galerina marginata CBS 339.88]|uniref:Uncharacterized protein n=1 Tax=Galerina marginata (strain CBS 339.88) TaxID=685588 RepID=A0A067SY46_GALM3|nr:hypothetical protein GALMADRAFT_252775 [Galerina marginata CBS 339.88]
MSRKRNADDSEDVALLDVQSPRKRTKTPFQPFPPMPVVASGSSSSSWTSSSPSRVKATAAAPFATPRTPYTPYPLQPSDSPSNPFGKNRNAQLTRSLPPESSFKKHVALRFQFVRTGKGKESVMSPRQGGVHRIARVPLNYTFVHLRCLIAWLFNTPAAYASAGATSLNGGAGDGYLFEVKDNATVYSPLYKPGQVKSGVTIVKLSNVRDPVKRWRARCGFGFGSEEDEDELSEEDDEEEDRSSEIGADEESEDWKWADEEDFTLGHAFPQGLNPEIAIIYHHSPTTQIHITVNKLLLPRQRGIANAPHVFTARGRVHLSPAPLPRLVFGTSTSILQSLSSSSPARPSPPRPRITRARVSALTAATKASGAMPVTFAPEVAPRAKGKDKGKGKAVVRLRSLTPPYRAPAGRKLFPRRDPTPKAKPAVKARKLRSPPPPARADEDEDEDVELTDADADGDTDPEHQDREKEPDSDGLHPFDATHPFFHAQGSSPLKPVPDLASSPLFSSGSNSNTNNAKRVVVLVPDSDDEQGQEPDHNLPSPVTSEDEDDSPSCEEEPHKTLNPDKWNAPPFAFARYLLEYMDPQGTALAVARGEVFDASFFREMAQGQEDTVVDPFDADDDDDDEEWERKKGDRKEDERKEAARKKEEERKKEKAGREKGGKGKTERDEESEDEDMEEVDMTGDQSTENEEDEDDDEVAEERVERNPDLKRKRSIRWTSEEKERERDRRLTRYLLENHEDDDTEEEGGDEMELEDDEHDQEHENEHESQEHTQGSTPGLTTGSSRGASSLPPSSPPRASSPTFEPLFPLSSFDTDEPASHLYSNRAHASSTSSLPDPSDFSSIVSAHYPNKKYTQTPAPPRAWTKRLRIERLEKRLERGKRGSYLTKYDEVDGGAAGEEGKEAEVDELAGDDEVKEEKWTKPVLKPGEVWDPFGDEEEI